MITKAEYIQSVLRLNVNISFIFFDFSFWKFVCKWNEVNECLNCYLVGHTIYIRRTIYIPCKKSVCETLNDHVCAFVCLKLKKIISVFVSAHTHILNVDCQHTYEKLHLATEIIWIMCIFKTHSMTIKMYILLTVFWWFNLFRSVKVWKTIISKSLKYFEIMISFPSYSE